MFSKYKIFAKILKIDLKRKKKKKANSLERKSTHAT
jgi:hypothetical protein